MSLPLEHAPSSVLRAALVGLSAGAMPPARPWPLFVGNEPSDPDDALTLYDTEGAGDGRSMIGGEVYEHHGFQLRIRAADHAAGVAKAYALKRAMAEAVLMLIVGVAGSSGVTYLLHAVTRIGAVVSLGKEVPSSKRYLFTINGTLALRRAS